MFKPSFKKQPKKGPVQWIWIPLIERSIKHYYCFASHRSKRSKRSKFETNPLTRALPNTKTTFLIPCRLSYSRDVLYRKLYRKPCVRNSCSISWNLQTEISLECHVSMVLTRQQLHLENQSKRRVHPLGKTTKTNYSKTETFTQMSGEGRENVMLSWTVSNIKITYWKLPTNASFTHSGIRLKVKCGK